MSLEKNSRSRFMKKSRVGIFPFDVSHKGEAKGKRVSRSDIFLEEQERIDVRILFFLYNDVVSFEKRIGFVRWKMEFVLFIRDGDG